MYITPPIQVTGAHFVLPSPRPASGAVPVAIQVSNNSSWVIGFNNGSEQLFIDPYTRTTFALSTITDSIPAVPVYQAYTLVGAGYVAADWLIAGEVPSQPDGSLPISQLISQAVQSITSVDGTLVVTNPNGPTTDLSASQLPQGCIASGTGPAATTDAVTIITVFGLNCNVVAGRRYRATVALTATTFTANSTSTLVSFRSTIANQRVDIWPAMAWNNGLVQYLIGIIDYDYTANGVEGFELLANSSAGSALRFAANSIKILVDDLGTLH